MSHGMMFGGFDFEPYLECNPSRPVLPPVEVEADEVPGAPGTRFRAAKLGELTITVSARLRPGAMTPAEARHLLASRLWTGEPAELILPDDPTMRHMAVLDGSSDLDTLWRNGSCELTFRCCDPVARGLRRSWSFTGTTPVHRRIGGNWPTRPVITAVPAAGGPFRITKTDTGEFVHVYGEFNGSLRLVIDCEAGHCEVNGSGFDEHVALESDYFSFEPGEDAWLVATGGDVTVEWDERWI